MAYYSELVHRLRGVNWVCAIYGKTEITHDTVCHEAADAIELLQREYKCANEMWEQQQELALEYLADIEKANERIAELEDALEAQAKRIAELEAMLKLSADFASKQQSLDKEFEKILFDNLDELYVVDPELEKGDE